MLLISKSYFKNATNYSPQLLRLYVNTKRCTLVDIIMCPINTLGRNNHEYKEQRIESFFSVIFKYYTSYSPLVWSSLRKTLQHKQNRSKVGQ